MAHFIKKKCWPLDPATENASLVLGSSTEATELHCHQNIVIAFCKKIIFAHQKHFFADRSYLFFASAECQSSDDDDDDRSDPRDRLD